MADSKQIEEYHYIIKNYDVQKLINDSDLPSADKNIIKNKILSNDVDLTEKLKILNYLLKYQKIEYYRGQVLLDTESGIDELNNTINSPGYYMIEVAGGNGGSFGSAPNSIALEERQQSDSKKSIYNFIIQPGYFINTSSADNTRLYFTTDFKWYYTKPGEYFIGTFELNDKAVFLHLKSHLSDSNITGNEEIQIIQSVENDLFVDEEKFYDYSEYNTSVLSLDLENYKILNFNILGQFKHKEKDDTDDEAKNQYETITLMDGFGVPANLLNNWDSLDINKYPNSKKFVDEFIDTTKYVFNEDNISQLPQSCVEKYFPKYININKNFSAGGSGGKLIKIVKIKKKVSFEYKAGKSGESSFNISTVKDGEDSYIDFYRDRGTKLVRLESKGGQSTINGNTPKGSGENSARWENDSIDDAYLTDSSKEIPFKIGPKSFLESDFDTSRFDGKSSVIVNNVDENYIENNIDSTEFYGSEIRGQGMNLTDFETVFYQPKKDGNIKIVYLGPLSSNSAKITIDTDENSISTVSETKVPLSANMKFLVKAKSQKYILDLQNSIMYLDDEQMSLYDILYDSENKKSHIEFSNETLKITKDLNYYIIEFNALKDTKIDLKFKEKRYFDFNRDLVGDDKDILSLTSNDPSLLTLNGVEDNLNIDILYKDIDYKFDDFLNKLYNKEFFFEAYSSQRRQSSCSLENIEHNNYLILKNIKKVCQTTFKIGQDLLLEEYRDHNNNILLKKETAKIIEISYSFDLNKNFEVYTDPIVSAPGTAIYVKLKYNTRRVRLSRIFSGLSSENLIYPINFDLVNNKQLDSETEFFQYIKIICDNTKTIIFNIERNTFKVKTKQCLYSLFDYKLLDNKEEYEYGEEIGISFIIDNSKYLSLRNTYDDEVSDYIVKPDFEKEIYESSILVGESKNTIMFGYKDQYSDGVDTFIEKLKGDCVCSRDYEFNYVEDGVQKSKNVQNLFFATNKSVLFANQEQAFIYFRMPENNISFRLTGDFLPNSRVLDLNCNEASYTLNKELYIRNILVGGPTGNGGNGFSCASQRRACRAGGSGGSGFLGGSAGSGSSTTDWGIYIDIPKGMNFWLKRLKVHGYIYFGLEFGIYGFPSGPAGCAAPGFKAPGKIGGDGFVYLASSFYSSPLQGSEDTIEGARITKTEDGYSFLEDTNLSMYRGRLLDYCAYLSKENRNESLIFFSSAGKKGSDGLDGVGYVMTKEPSGKIVYLKNDNGDIVTKTIYGVYESGEISWDFLKKINVDVAMALVDGKVGSRSYGELMGMGTNGGAGSAGLPSLFRTSKNGNIEIVGFQEDCLTKIIKQPKNVKAIVSGGGVDGFSTVTFIPIRQKATGADHDGQAWKAKANNLKILIGFEVRGGDLPEGIELGITLNSDSVITDYFVKTCEQYPISKTPFYEKYLLAPLVFDPSHISDAYYTKNRDGTKTPSTLKKYFGLGGGKQQKDVIGSLDYEYGDFIGNGGYSGVLQKSVQESYSSFNTITFPPNIHEDIMQSTNIDFTDSDSFLNSIDGIKSISDNIAVPIESDITEKQKKAYLNLEYQTQYGVIPNSNGGSIIFILGPKRKDLNHRFTVNNLQESSLNDLNKNQSKFERNWFIKDTFANIPNIS